MSFVDRLADELGYNEMEDGGVDALIDYKNALEDEAATVDGFVLAYVEGELDARTVLEALRTRGFGWRETT